MSGIVDHVKVEATEDGSYHVSIIGVGGEVLRSGYTDDKRRAEEIVDRYPEGTEVL